ncbi:hypothetical protein B0H19DRAFT_1138530 [Mycena capillaripes]|nr:hypothetical protein B0H19DRAFT_1138530 [Mycena capillaripes]
MPKPTMKLPIPEYNPELEYTLNLGGESTPLPSDVGPAAPRARDWRPAGHESEQKARSSAYDAAGNLKVAVRGRRAAAKDCGICQEVAVEPVRTQCCGALFCREHIDDWLFNPAATGLCPACNAPCLLPPSKPVTPSHPLAQSSFPSSTLTALDLDELQEAEPVEESDSHDLDTNSNSKYTRPGADALVRLLSVLAALVLLIGALSRRGGWEGFNAAESSLDAESSSPLVGLDVDLESIGQVWVGGES